MHNKQKSGAQTQTQYDRSESNGIDPVAKGMAKRA